MAKIQFKSYPQGQTVLFPSDLGENIPENDPVRIVSRTSKELYARLQSLERKRQETAENLYRYEQRIDGKRCYMGCPLPDDAPPRPSPKAIWNNLAGCWHEPTG